MSSPTLRTLTLGGQFLKEDAYMALGDFIKQHKGSLQSRLINIDLTKSSLTPELLLKIVTTLITEDKDDIFRFKIGSPINQEHYCVLANFIQSNPHYAKKFEFLDPISKITLSSHPFTSKDILFIAQFFAPKLKALEVNTPYKPLDEDNAAKFRFDFNPEAIAKMSRVCCTFKKGSLQIESLNHLIPDLIAQDKDNILEFNIQDFQSEQLDELTSLVTTYPEYGEKFYFSELASNQANSLLFAFKRVCQEGCLTHSLPSLPKPLINIISQYSQ